MATKQGDPLLYEKRDRAVPIMETLTVFNKRAVLSEVPDRFMKVFINDYNESESMYMSDDEYYVDYTNGFVYMADNVPDGQTLTCSYYGMGSVKVPASRVYFHDRVSDDIVSDLQEMIDFGKENANAVAEIKRIYEEANLYMETAKSTFFLNTGGLIRGNVYVEGKVEAEELVTFQKDLNVLGSETVDVNLTIGDPLLKTSIFTLYGDSNIDGSQSITGNQSVAGTISGNSLSSNTLNTTNLATLGSLLVNGTSNLKGSLIVYGGTNLTNGLSVTGTTTLNESLNVVGESSFTGLATFNDIKVNGTLVGNVVFSNDIIANSNIKVMNNLDVMKDLNVYGIYYSKKPISANNKIFDLQQGYAIYSDNIGTGTAKNRLWIDAPNGGEIIFGGRTSGVYLDDFTIKSKKLSIDTGSGLYGVATEGMLVEKVADVETTLKQYANNRANEAEANAKNASLLKNKYYNGVSVSDASGLVVTRSDGKIQTILNATTGIGIYEKTSGRWRSLLHADTSGNLQVRNLVVNDGSVTIKRPDGYTAIYNGYINQDFTVHPHFPDYRSSFVGTEGYWYTVSRWEWGNCNFFTFNHKARYLYITVAHIFLKGYGVGQFRIIEDPANPKTVLSYQKFSNGADWYHKDATMGRRLKIDLGTPTGRHRSFYLQIASDSYRAKHMFRFSTMYLSDF